MKIGIVGTRGIPNLYGGFEQFAQEFSVRMTAKGHSISVYASHNHPFTKKIYKGVKIIHCYDPEYKIGTAGQFIYDFNCIKDTRKRNFDIILQLGYTSSTIWSWLYPKNALLVTNMDGLEWSRSKYSKKVQAFLKRAEHWGVKYSDYLIADSQGIQDYLRLQYNASSVFVAYGADLFMPSVAVPSLLNGQLLPYDYDLAIARFEPENSIEILLKTYSNLPTRKLVLVGNYSNNAFGIRMHELYNKNTNIIFTGGIYESDKINELRYYSRIYIHGHTVGGTNPSLLEAMGCSALICANDNHFNRYVLNNAAFYFNTETDLAALVSSEINKYDYQSWITDNKLAITKEYSWNHITAQLEDYFKQWLAAK